MKHLVWILAGLLLLGCKNKEGSTTGESKDGEYELLTRAQSFFQPLSEVEMQSPDPNQVKLGKHLFYDTRLSGEGNISCNSCHNLNTYGVDNLQFSPGDAEGTMGTRNSPTVIHAALHKMQFWDGRAEDVEEQAGGPILNPLEHNIKNEEELMNRIKNVEEYQEMFKEAYGSDAITFENLTHAIGAFERTLMPESRFDEFLEGKVKALNEQEKRGLNSFIEAGCITCHSGVALGGQMYQKFGLNGEYWKHTESENIDLGLYEISDSETDKYFFKVPGLRNIAHTYPYFHDGSVADLKEAVQIMGNLQTQVDLSKKEIEDIVAFMESLSADVSDEAKENPFEKN